MRRNREELKTNSPFEEGLVDVNYDKNHT